jgi:hypothetical protein
LPESIKAHRRPYRDVSFINLNCIAPPSALNLVEQINQTWTYLVALAAAKQLLTLHPEAGGYRLAPGRTRPTRSIS